MQRCGRETHAWRHATHYATLIVQCTPHFIKRTSATMHSNSVANFRIWCIFSYAGRSVGPSCELARCFVIAKSVFIKISSNQPTPVLLLFLTGCEPYVAPTVPCMASASTKLLKERPESLRAWFPPTCSHAGPLALCMLLLT